MSTDSLSALPWESKQKPSFVNDEKLLRFSRRHWIIYIAPIVIYMFLGSLCVMMFIGGEFLNTDSTVLSRGSHVLALAGLVIVHHWAFHRILSDSTYDVILTNKQMLYLTHRLWLDDSMHSIALNQIVAVEVSKHGIVKHILDYGELWFDTGGSTAGELHQTIPFVPDPQTWADDIERAIGAI